MGTKSGDTCQAAGTYQFDGYIDGSTSQPPKGEEVRITLKTGDLFPAVASSGKEAWHAQVGR